MAVLTQNVISITGVAPTFVAASAGGDSVAPGDRAYIHVKNGGASAITVTVATPGNTKWGQAVPDVPVTVAASSEQIIGPLQSDLADPSDGNVHITYSAVTSVTIAALR